MADMIDPQGEHTRCSSPALNGTTFNQLDPYTSRDMLAQLNVLVAQQERLMLRQFRQEYIDLDLTDQEHSSCFGDFADPCKPELATSS